MNKMRAKLQKVHKRKRLFRKETLTKVKFEKGENNSLIRHGISRYNQLRLLHQNNEKQTRIRNMDEFAIKVTAASGWLLPYTRYIEAEIDVENVPEPITTLEVVTPPTPFNIRVLLLIGTYVIKEYRRTVEEEAV